MRVLIEGEKYPLLLLEEIIDSRFYKTYGINGIVSHIGYFYSHSNNEIVYILPKVFIDKDEIVLFDFEKNKLAKTGLYIDNHDKSETLKKLLILFYRSLREYKKRQPSNSIINKDAALVLDSNIGDHEYSYLDIILNIVNFHTENKNTILFIEKKHRSQQHKKVSWEKTIKKDLPFLYTDNNPIHIQAVNKKKYIDSEETLLSMFYSVLYHIKNEYKFNVQIDKIYNIQKGKAFDTLKRKAPKILRKIKHKYFSDTLVRIFKLMEIYFSTSNTANSKKKKEEFIRVDNYHIIFEDMIDKLFSDELPNNFKKLKEQKDGKEIDHIFQYDALINDKEQIFYIGDSKYYKIDTKTGTDSTIGENSKYKQFTYAKNVIQFNVGVMNGKKEKIEDERIRYLDEITEGYNISPNFFIQGRIYPNLDFEDKILRAVTKEPESSYHFENRLFDRDTLFVHYYNINFLFVLKSYSQINSMKLRTFRNDCKQQFRTSLIDYLNQNYSFYEKRFETITHLKEFVDSNYRKYNGQMYRSEEASIRLIIASKNSLTISSFNQFKLT